MLIKKAVAVRKHLSTNRKDKDGKLYVGTLHRNQLDLDLHCTAASFSSSPVSTVSPATTRPSVPSPRTGGTRAPLPPPLSHKRVLVACGWSWRRTSERSYTGIHALRIPSRSRSGMNQKHYLRNEYINCKLCLADIAMVKSFVSNDLRIGKGLCFLIACMHNSCLSIQRP
jgi:hypothetical protein